jgi:DNA-binding transcriptional LysR family regulator
VCVVVSKSGAALHVVAANLGLSVVPLDVGRRSALNLRTISLGDAWAERSFAICFRDFEALQPASQRLAEHLQLRAAHVKAAP